MALKIHIRYGQTQKDNCKGFLLMGETRKLKVNHKPIRCKGSDAFDTNQKFLVQIGMKLNS